MDGAVDMALGNNPKTYGEVIATQHVLEIKDTAASPDVAKLFAQVSLEPRLEVAEAGFAFWKPDEAEYRTQSRPE